jgi:hypothetical protein
MVGGFVFPFANPRHAHEYHCFEGGVLDDDQILVAGVIDPLTNFVEHPEVVAERIERVAAAVGDPRRVLAGTDCGFDTSAGMGRVAEDVVWAKLGALSDGARLPQNACSDCYAGEPPSGPSGITELFRRRRRCSRAAGGSRPRAPANDA